MSTTHLVFVSCLPRFEVLLDEELQQLLPDRRRARKRGGTEIRVTPEELWGLAHDLRIAESLRVRVGHFPAGNFDELINGLKKLPWSVYIPRGAAPRIEASTTNSVLYHADAVAERVHAFFVERGVTDHPPLAPTVFIRLVNDVAVVSVDASAELLHRRGVRSTTTRAPLRETYAAACLRATGMDTSMDLVDPVCGSGVFLTERAMIGGGTALPRWFAFELWPTHDAEAYAAWTYARPQVCVPEGLRLGGADRSANALEAARENLQRLEGGPEVTLFHGDVRAYLAQLSPSTDVIANPPWGERVSGASQVGAAFGHWLRQRPTDATGRVAVLVNGHEFLRATGERWREVLSFRDGGLPVRLMMR